ncbi:M20 family metallopeptidase [Enemella evansiae]|uniref:M20 family metallopeptidase n=1 Tax=Enemella evansiae TaxID=2016499 RepID=UPI000B965B57|nr:M20 family metallopeptidase [Enemella evansiae]OYO06237.1 acetylornithine deacetylase [Enemella evansiae]
MISECERRVLAAIDAEQIAAVTAELIAAPSENPGQTEERTVAVLEAACRRAGLQVERRPVAEGRENLFAALAGGDRPGLLFLGHSDVVPAGPGWSADPFLARRDGDRIIGRGASDMKGGLAAIVAAMGALRTVGVRPAGEIRLACTVDEEDLGLGIRALAADGLAGEFAGCVVAEPTDLELVIACRGDSYLELQLSGVPAHSGRPADGRNAIDAATRVLELIRADQAELARSQDRLLGSGTWSVGRISGGRGTSIVAPDCTVWVDRRLMPDERPQQIAERLAARADRAGITGDGIGLRIEVTMEMPGFRTPVDDPLVRTVRDAARDLGVEPEVTGWTAACDGGFVARDLGIPTVVMGPGGLNDQAHQVDESVSLDELVRAAKRYALLAMRVPESPGRGAD